MQSSFANRMISLDRRKSYQYRSLSDSSIADEMDRLHSPATEPAPESAPEVVPGTSRSAFAYVGSDDYEYYEPQPSTFERQRSPAPEYPQYEDSTISLTSPRISAQSPPLHATSDIGRSPRFSESGLNKSGTLSPSVQYSEIHSPDPETVVPSNVYNHNEKEAIYNPTSKVPSYHSYPSPGIIHTNSGDQPQAISAAQRYPYYEPTKRKPFFKRWKFILGMSILAVIIVIVAILGVIFGLKKSKASKPAAPKITGDPNVAVGGYLSSAYYSTSGAFNGSGIAIAAAKPGVDQTLYAFYQDSSGAIQYTFMDALNTWNLVGPVNSKSFAALNGTPLSTVNHQLGNQLVWHLFYIDSTYTIRERIITNTTTDGVAPIWKDGPLNALNLKVWKSPTIGMQACYWGNYYGQWSYSDTQASAGIHLWYADSPTTFQQYSWTNGTNSWIKDTNVSWTGLSGNAGVGCQTWDSGLTEYVWFVDTKNEIAMYWKDGNRSAVSTPTHPVNSWTPIDIGIKNVQKDSSLGYTNYMVYQAEDTTINGANIVWAAENTTIYKGANGPDTWVLQNNGANVHALRGTHLSVTATTTASKGKSILVFFQQLGDDMRMYMRDAYNAGGLWNPASQDPVRPSNQTQS